MTRQIRHDSLRLRSLAPRLLSTNIRLRVLRFGVEKNNINSTACLKADDGEAPAAVIAAPSAAQRGWMGTMLRTFHHFDICTFTGCEHNSGTANKSQGSGKQDPVVAL